MDLSIIIVNWNSAHLLGECLNSIQTWLTDIEYEAIIVDNNSTETDQLYLKEELSTTFPWARFIYSKENLGFARANNLAVESARGEFVLLLNPDTLFIQAGFKNLFKYFETAEVGMVCCKLLNSDKTLQHSLHKFPTLMNVASRSLLLHKLLPDSARFQYSDSHYSLKQIPDWAFGAFMLMKRSCFESLSGFDETIFMYGEDLDLCYRLNRQGKRVVYTPDYEIIHYGGSSGKLAWSNEQKEIMTYRALHNFYRVHIGKTRLIAARIFWGLGACFRLAGYGISSCWPGRYKRARHEIKTQWFVLLTQLNLK